MKLLSFKSLRIQLLKVSIAMYSSIDNLTENILPKFNERVFGRLADSLSNDISEDEYEKYLGI